jgi:hypothetical protein
MTKNPDGTFPYKSLLDCAYKTAKNESIIGFWAGLPTYIFRIAPHVMIVRFLYNLYIINIDFGGFRITKETFKVKTLKYSNSTM